MEYNNEEAKILLPEDIIQQKKGLYTLLSRCIDPWNNRKVWVDNYFFR